MILPTKWDLPEAIRARLGDKAGRQRAMVADGHLLLVLHRPTQLGIADTEAVLFWRHPDGQWEASKGAQGPSGIRRQLSAHADALAELEHRYQAAESSGDYFLVLAALSPLQRAVHNQYLTMQSAREQMPDVHELIVLRDWAEELAHDAELLHIDSRYGLEHAIAMQTEAQARSAHQIAQASHALNMLAAIFLPIMAVSSLFGMNLPHGMEHAPPSLFWTVMTVALLSGLMLYGFMTGRVATWLSASPPPSPSAWPEPGQDHAEQPATTAPER